MLDAFRKFLARHWQLLAALALLAVGIIAYFPSFFHAARADQLNYLADTARMPQNWYDLAVRTFDLNRTRLFGAGDEIFFRPLLYFFLGNERAFFGCHYPLWQITGFLAHAAVCFFLWRVLNLIRRGPAALWATGFFALLYANLEAVIWHHITAYVIFALLILAAMEMALKYAQNRSRLRFSALVLLLSAAMFTYEVGLWYGLCFFFFLHTWPGEGDTRRSSLWWLFVPCVLYAAASAADAMFLGSAVVRETKTLADGFHLWETLQNFFITLKWDVFAGLFLTNADVSSAARLSVSQDVFAWGWPFTQFKAYYLLGVGIAAAWGLIVAQGKSGISPQNKRILAWTGAMLAGYLLIIVVGRVNPLGYQKGMLSTLYYLYNFWIIFIVFLYAAAAPAMEKNGLAVKASGWVLAGLMAVFMLCNAGMIYRQNKQIKDMYMPVWTFVSHLNGVMDRHGREPDFSFYVRPDYPGNYLGRWFVKGQPDLIASLGQVLFARSYNDKDPKYVLISAPRAPQGTLCVKKPSGYQCGSEIP